MWHHGQRGVDGAPEIDGEHAPEIVQGQGRQRRDLNDARVVDQDIHAAVMREGGFHETVHHLGLADVAHHGEHLRPPGPQMLAGAGEL